MRTRALAAMAIIATSALGACTTAAPVNFQYTDHHAQQTMPSNTMLGEACDGHSSSESLRLSGHTYLTADFNIDSVVFGARVPYEHISGPVSKGTSQMVRPVFSGAHGPESCSGLAVRTIVRREGQDVFMDWVLELATRPGSSDIQPVDAWRVAGRTPVDSTGYATDTVAFRIAGKDILVHLNIMPGAVWVAEQNHWRAQLWDHLHPAPAVASPLPDELPGRTLYDVTNPAYRH